MKRVYVDEKWCLGCHLCEYNCAFANSGGTNMAKALKSMKIRPRIHIEGEIGTGENRISYAVSCRHCEDPICVRSCIAGAITKDPDGMVSIDHDKCVKCYTCVLVCPYGSIVLDEDGTVQKCELCLKNSFGSPACVAGCPNQAIIYEER